MTEPINPDALPAALAALRAAHRLPWFVADCGELFDAAERLFAEPDRDPLRCSVRFCPRAPTTGTNWLEDDGIGCATVPLCERHLRGLHRAFPHEPAPNRDPREQAVLDAARAWIDWLREPPRYAVPIAPAVANLAAACEAAWPEAAPQRCAVPGCGAEGCGSMAPFGGTGAVCELHFDWLQGLER